MPGVKTGNWIVSMSLMALVSAVFVFISVGRLHEPFVRYTGAIPAAKLVMALGAIAFLLNPSLDKISAATRTIQGKAVIVFIFSILLSLPFSYYRAGSLESASVFLFAAVPIMLIWISSIKGIEDIERLLRAAALVVVVAASVIVVGFGTVQQTPDGPRVSLSGSYDSNDLAMVIVSCMACSLWAIKDRTLFWRLVGYGGLVGGVYIVVRTGSRGGSLALAALIFLATFTVKNAVPRWFRAAIVPLAVVAYLTAPASYRDRLATLGNTSEDYNTFSETGRIKVWKRGVTYFLSRPLTGVGVGQFAQAEGRWGAANGFSHGWKWSAPHNMYVEAAAELGIFGIASLLCVLFPTLRRTWRVMRTDPRHDLDSRRIRVAGAIFLAMSSFMVGGIFLTAALTPLFCFLIALTIGLESVVGSAAQAQTPVLRTDDRNPGAPGMGRRRATRWTGRAALAAKSYRATSR